MILSCRRLQLSRRHHPYHKPMHLSKQKSASLLRIPVLRRCYAGELPILGTSVVCQMADSSVISTLDVMIGGLAIGSLLYTCKPLLTFERSFLDRPALVDEDESIKWTVAGVISFIPCFNWVAWVFVALDEEESFSYFLLAALYGIPFLTEGFSLGSLSWFMLVAGAVHLQAERVLQTEVGSHQGSEITENSVLVDFIRRAQSQAIMLLSKGGKSDPKDIRGSLSETEPKQMSIQELVDKKMETQADELKSLKEVSDIEKSLWDKRLDDRSDRTKD